MKLRYKSTNILFSIALVILLTNTCHAQIPGPPLHHPPGDHFPNEFPGVHFNKLCHPPFNPGMNTCQQNQKLHESLLAETVEKLEELRFRTRQSEIQLKAEIETAELDLHREMRRDEPDLKALEKIIERLNKSRGDLFRIHVLAQAKEKMIISKQSPQN